MELMIFLAQADPGLLRFGIAGQIAPQLLAQEILRPPLARLRSTHSLHLEQLRSLLKFITANYAIR